MKNNLPENEQAVWILKTKGPLPLTTLAASLSVTTEGARFQLQKLAAEGLVKASTVAKGRGRPQQIWSLTEKGEARFPDTHADLTVRLIQSIRDTLGEAALDAVIISQQKNSIRKYNHELSQYHTLEEKVKGLAEIRDNEGYMAEYTKDEEGYLLIENHCPVCAAATTCQGFCKAELESFRQVLAKEAKVTRIDHIISGARRCAYRISPRTI
ncbi:metalloregulator ArsR/SmtB family transcription factor [Chitinophaga sp. Cy-1792]|uniref:helix-turn-helix transcriptional regulator n=1 Tax=Chitinophaga sp. Cy-1792 TaxID=2608339 RepID=UPI001421FAB0|nr:metalloregulator ArsR/SmtB family transcription factor [Chitinophaga sp. Cy-1792]NIG57457.1 transcriptional regulator [Chitinophaga sp. Cy-1792]